MTKETIQKCYLQHDWLYASRSLIPANALDGKETPSVVYIITDEPITETISYGYSMYDSESEALEIILENE